VAIVIVMAIVLAFFYGKKTGKPEKVDPRIELEFNKVFMTTSNDGKEGLIQRGIDKKKCGRGEAMRLAVEEWRRERR